MSRYEIATHEGRHCVAAWAHGIEIESVAAGEHTGRCIVQIPDRRLSADDMWAMTIIYASGPAGDSTSLPLSGQDLHDTSEWYARWARQTGTLRPLEAAWPEIRLECSSILYTHRARVTQVADALLEHGRLTSSDIARLLGSNGSARPQVRLPSSKPKAPAKPQRQAARSQPTRRPAARCCDLFGHHAVAGKPPPPAAGVDYGKYYCQNCLDHIASLEWIERERDAEVSAESWAI